MQVLYQLTHERIVEKNVYDTKVLGFFSSKKKCNNAIEYYSLQPGFREYKKDFVVSIVEANVNDFNNTIGEFGSVIYVLMHEWYDGQYDYISYLGCYSCHDYAHEAKEKYSQETDFIEHPEGFAIDEYEVNQMEWKEGFFSY